MHTLFQEPLDQSRGITQPAQWSYIRERLRDNVVRVVRHIRDSHYSVDSRHLLVRLLTDLNVDYNEPLMEYHRIVSERALKVAKANRITSSTWRGEVLEEGIFYGDDTQEALIANNEDFDVLRVEENWQLLRPVKVLRHDRTSLSINALDGEYEPKEPGTAVIQIDVVKLAHQYRQWMLDQHRRGVEHFESPQHFVYRYPLANALFDHHDWSIFNRLMCIDNGNEPVKTVNNWPMYIDELSSKVDDYIYDRLEVLHRRSDLYDVQLQHVACAFHEHARDLVQHPPMPYTRQIKWALNLARIPTISWLARLNYEIGSAKNRHYESHLRKQLERLYGDRDFEFALPSDKVEDVFDTLERGIERYL